MSPTDGGPLSVPTSIEPASVGPDVTSTIEEVMVKVAVGSSRGANVANRVGVAVSITPQNSQGRVRTGVLVIGL